MRQDKYDYTVEGNPPAPGTATRYFSPNQIYVGTFLGGPVAAIWYLARNFSAFGQDEAVRSTWLYGALFTLVFVEVLLFLPDDIPSVAYSAFYTGIAAFLLEKYQAKNLKAAAEDAQALKESNWKVAGIAVVGIIAVLAQVVVQVALTEMIFPGSVPGLEETTGTL